MMNHVTFTIDNIDYTFQILRGQVLDRQSNSRTSFASQVSTYRDKVSHTISSSQTDYHSIYILNKDTNLEERITFLPDWDPSVRNGHDITLLLFKQAKNQKGKIYKFRGDIVDACCALVNNNTGQILWAGFPFVASVAVYDFWIKVAKIALILLALTIFMGWEAVLMTFIIFGFLIVAPSTFITAAVKKRKVKDDDQLSQQAMQYLADANQQ